MAPKRKAETDTPVTGEQYNIEKAEQRAYMLSTGIMAEEDIDSAIETTPPKKKAKKNEPVATKVNELLHSAPEPTADDGAAETQGTVETPPKKTPARGRKRKTSPAAKVSAAGTSLDNGDVADSTTGTPAVKGKKATAAPRKPRKKKANADAAPGASAGDVAKPVLPPLPPTLQAKVQNIHTFLDTQLAPTISRDANNLDHALVRETDLLAALVTLRADYSLSHPTQSLSLADAAADRIVKRHGAGWCTVDFSQSVPMELEAQAKIAGRGLDLEDVNLLEVEMEMMKARREWLESQGRVEAGFRAWDDQGDRVNVDGELAGVVIPDEKWLGECWKGVCPVAMAVWC